MPAMRVVRTAGAPVRIDQVRPCTAVPEPLSAVREGSIRCALPSPSRRPATGGGRASASAVPPLLRQADTTSTPGAFPRGSSEALANRAEIEVEANGLRERAPRIEGEGRRVRRQIGRALGVGRVKGSAGRDRRVGCQQQALSVVADGDRLSRQWLAADVAGFDITAQHALGCLLAKRRRRRLARVAALCRR